MALDKVGSFDVEVMLVLVMGKGSVTWAILSAMLKKSLNKNLLIIIKFSFYYMNSLF